MTDPTHPDQPPGEAGEAAPLPPVAALPPPPTATVPRPPDAEAGDPARLPPGAATFTIEGRAAPGLYFVGWIATILGLGVLLVGIMAGGGQSAVVLTLAGSAVAGLGFVSAAGAQAFERRARGRVFAGPSPFLVFVASLPLTIVAVVLVVAPAAALGLDATSPVATFVSIAATALVYVGLIWLLVVGPGALGWREMGVGPLDRRALADLAAGAALALPIVLLTSVLAVILVQVVGAAPDSPLPPSSTALGFLLNLATAAVVAPVGEELFFRGFATTAWVKGMGPVRGLVRGALFFALVHVLTIGGQSFGDAGARALVAFAARIPVALALGWVFLRRRSIYASIGLHASFNGILVVLAELAARAGGA